jgi:hypothetical protein
MIFAIVFEKGFAILDNLISVYSLIVRERNIVLKAFESAELSYRYCCETFIKHWLDKGNEEQPPLPRLEELLQAGGIYINPFTEVLIYPVCRVGLYGEPIRYFSVNVPFKCACVDSVTNAISIIGDEIYPEVTEFYTPEKAEMNALYLYKVQMMSFGAYLTDNIYLPARLPLNEIFYNGGQVLMPTVFNNSIHTILK